MSGAPKKDHAPKPDQIEYYQPEQLLQVDYARTPEQPWMDQVPEPRPGNFIWPAKPKNLEYVGFPNARDWSPLEADRKLPANWKEIIIEGIRERLDKYRG